MLIKDLEELLQKIDTTSDKDLISFKEDLRTNYLQTKTDEHLYVSLFAIINKRLDKKRG